MKNYITEYSKFIFEKKESSDLKGIDPENMIRKIRRSKADSVGGVAGAISRHHAKGQQEESKFKRIRRSVGGGLRRTASAFERLGQRRKREIEDQQRTA